MKSLLPSALGVLLVALSTGCYTTQIQPDYARQANAHLAAQEKPGASAADAEQKESLRRLWSDVPEYAAAVIDARPLLKSPRLVSSTPPTYPLMPLLGGVKSRVVVSFVVSRTGTVAAARVLESSDSRFDQAAVESVLKWKFLPGENADGPTIVVMAAPIEFAGMK